MGEGLTSRGGGGVAGGFLSIKVKPDHVMSL